MIRLDTLLEKIKTPALFVPGSVFSDGETGLAAFQTSTGTVEVSFGQAQGFVTLDGVVVAMFERNQDVSPVAAYIVALIDSGEQE